MLSRGSTVLRTGVVYKIILKGEECLDSQEKNQNLHHVWRGCCRSCRWQWLRHVQGRFRRWRRASRRLPFHRRSTPSSRSYGRDGTEGLLRRRWSPIQERYIPVLSLLYNAIHSVSRPLYHFVTESLWGVGMGYHPNRPFVADNKSLFSLLSFVLCCMVKNVYSISVSS